MKAVTEKEIQRAREAIMISRRQRIKDLYEAEAKQYLTTNPFDSDLLGGTKNLLRWV